MKVLYSFIEVKEFLTINTPTYTFDLSFSSKTT